LKWWTLLPLCYLLHAFDKYLNFILTCSRCAICATRVYLSVQQNYNKENLWKVLEFLVTLLGQGIIHNICLLFIWNNGILVC